MPLTAEEKVRIRYHMGYPLQGSVRSLFASVPFNRQTLYLLEGVMETIAEESLPQIRKILGYLDKTDEKIFCDQKNMQADQIEELRLNESYHPKLRREYTYWQGRLAQCLDVPLNMDFQPIRGVDAGIRQVKLG